MSLLFVVQLHRKTAHKLVLKISGGSVLEWRYQELVISRRVMETLVRKERKETEMGSLFEIKKGERRFPVGGVDGCIYDRNVSIGLALD